MNKRGNGPISLEWKNASVTDLELALAQDASSTAFFPLVAAYLDQKRFMEAMVVCKKRIKSQPNELEARSQLALVYVRQNKLSRAMQEMDDLVKGNDDNAIAYLERGKVKLASEDEDGGVADLKKAIDLDDDLAEPKELLKDRGIIYPEPPPAPPPQPTPSPDVPSFPQQVHVSGITSARPHTGESPMMGRPVSGEMVPGHVTGEMAPMMPRTISGELAPMDPRARGPSGRHMLEGEDELEAMANKVAEERPAKGGSARTTLMLLGACTVVLIVGIVMALRHKHIAENVDRLTREARPQFEEDTYVGYKRAAEKYRDVIQDYDSKHENSVGRYAHALAILWGEHRETDRIQELVEAIERAQKYAKGSPHTWAATGIYELHLGKDRQASAQKAWEKVTPFTTDARKKNWAPSVANLTLGIIEMELGNYDTAVEELTGATQSMPGSVRAKVWLARARLRSGDMSAASREFGRALQSSKNHLGALAGRALVRIRQGNLGGAGVDVKAFDDYEKNHPREVSPSDKALIFYAKSEAFRRNGQEEIGKAKYDEAVALDPENADFPHGLGLWLLKVGQAEEAIKLLFEALKMEPTRKVFVLDLADAEIKTNKLSTAETRIEKLLAKNPKDLDAALVKARLLRKKNDPKAESYIKEVMKWSNDHALAKRELAMLYWKSRGDKAAADKIFGPAINESTRLPPAQQAEILYDYGAFSEDRGDENTAIKTFEFAEKKGSLPARFRLCSLLANRDRKRARAYCAAYYDAGKSLPNAKEAERIFNELK